MHIARAKLKKYLYLFGSRTSFSTTMPVYRRNVLSSIAFHRLTSVSSRGCLAKSEGDFPLSSLKQRDISIRYADANLPENIRRVTPKHTRCRRYSTFFPPPLFFL